MTKMLRGESVIPANQTLMQVKLSSSQLRRELGARNPNNALFVTLPEMLTESPAPPNPKSPLLVSTPVIGTVFLPPELL